MSEDNSNDSSNNATTKTSESSPEKRSVCFVDAAKLCVYHAGAVLDEVELSRKDIWFQQADLAQIKRKAMVISREAHRYGFGSLLTNTYGNAGEETQDALNTWCRNANARRGLERWINDEYSAKRSDLRKRTIQSVLRAQNKMRQEDINDPEYCWKVLARLSEAFSQDSSDFARAMGVADELAAAQPSDTNDNTGHKSGGCATSASSSSQRRGPERKTSPRSVVLPRQPPRKNLGLSSGSSGEFRHFY